MNAREGMRRLGIVLGILGGIAGGFFGYTDVQNVWTSHRKFESLLASPTVQKAAEAAKDYQQNPGGRQGISLPEGYKLDLPSKGTTSSRRITVTHSLTGQSATVDWSHKRPSTVDEADELVY